jgi:hypothetical protein
MPSPPLEPNDPESSPARVPALLRVAAPCDAEWDGMTGSGRVRRCQRCSNHVYSFSSMPREEADALVRRTEGRSPGAMYQRADGTVMACDCPVGLKGRRIRRVAFAALGAGLLVAAGLSLASLRPTAAHPDEAPVKVEVAAPSSAPSVEAPTPSPPGSGGQAARSGGPTEVPSSAHGGAPRPDMTRVLLERTVCFGVCPAYTVAIDADGTVTYEGKDFVRVHGKQVRHIDPGAVEKLFEHVASAHFFELRERYSMSITDNPTALLSVTTGGHTRKVEDYPPCHKGETFGTPTPPALCALEHEVDALAKTDAWVECPSDGRESYCEKR